MHTDRTMRARAVTDRLSRREQEVLGLMASGWTNGAICGQLWLSPKTLETHIRHIFDKLGLLHGGHEHRRVAAVLAYLELPSR